MTEGGRRLREAAARLGSHQSTRLLAGAAMLGVGIVLGVLAALLIVDRFLPLPAGVRAFALLVAVVMPAVVFARALLRRLPALRDLEEAARRTETESAALQERLVPALQVLEVRDHRRTGYSPELVDAFVDETAAVAERVRAAELPYNLRFRNAWIAAVAGVVAGIVAVAVLGPVGAASGLSRLAGSYAELGPRPPATFAVDPGDVSIPRGKDVTLAARVEHARLRDGVAEAVLQWRNTPEAEWTDVALSGRASDTDVPTARFEHRFAGVRESFRYRFAHAGELSEEFSVSAVPHPSLTIDEVRYHYPEYTGLPVRSERNGGGDLAAVKGSSAEILVRCTNVARVARLALDSGGETELALGDDGRLRATIDITGEDSYRLHVEDTLGLVNQNPLTYRVRALPDEAPFIRVLEPGEDVDLDEDLRVALRFSAVDDFGLGEVRVVWEVSRREGEKDSRVIHRPAGRVTEINERWDWDVEPLELLPGDTVVYHLEVSDNNAVDGPSTARTRDYVLRFPTLGEIYAEIDDAGEGSIEDLEDVAREAKRVEDQIEEVSREILKQGETSWENRQEVERALQSQEQLAEQLEKTREQIQENMDRLAESEFSTLEALQKMEQIQKLLDEVVTEEMREALDKLRQAMEQANPRRMQEDLAEFRASQEETMESLDRIMENLKQFRFEERLKAAVREVEELAARQEHVNDELRAAAEPQDSEQEDRSGERADRDESDDKEEESASEGDKGSQAEPESLRETDAASEDASKSPEESEASTSESESGDETKTGEEAREAPDGETPEGDTPTDSSKPEDLESLAHQEDALAEEARRIEQELRELADMTRELRDGQDQQTMGDMAQKMDANDIPETMDQMSGQMRDGDSENAEESGEKALTELRETLTMLQQGQQGMSMRMIQISQAALNRAVRDLLSVSGDEERLAGDLAEIPRNTNSATRAFADEQHLLIDGAERVDEMLTEVAKDTPLMDSVVGETLDKGILGMKEAAFGLESGAVHVARDDGDRAVEDLNAVVIHLLQTVQSMSSCASGKPTSGFMQQLQDLSGDQEKLNQALQEMMRQGGSSLDHRLQAQLRSLAEEQQRIRDQLQQLLDEAGSGQHLLGRLDQVTEKLDEVAKKMRDGRLDEETIRDQDWALTRLLDSQRSLREREFGRQRKSESAEELAEILPPGALPDGLDEGKRDLREDLLKALDRRYPPKYEELIRRYFRSLSDEDPGPDLP